MRRQRIARVAVLATAAVAALAAARLAAAWVEGAMARTLLVFVVTMLAADTVRLVLSPPAQAIFYEDVARDLAAFTVVGAVAGAALHAGERFAGAPLNPALPAFAAYAVASLWRRRPPPGE